MESKKQTPDWHSERFYESNIKPELDKNDSMTMEWLTSKQAMIATLNYLRFKYKLNCFWIDKGHDFFIIKIEKQIQK